MLGYEKNISTFDTEPFLLSNHNLKKLDKLIHICYNNYILKVAGLYSNREGNRPFIILEDVGFQF